MKTKTKKMFDDLQVEMNRLEAVEYVARELARKPIMFSLPSEAQPLFTRLRALLGVGGMKDENEDSQAVV